MIVIIKINTLGRPDKDDLEKTAGLIQERFQKLGEQVKVISMSEIKLGLGTADSHTNVRICMLGHSNSTVNEFAGRDAGTLAGEVGTFINKLSISKYNVREIFLSCCNMGKSFEGSTPFVVQFAEKLSHIIRTKSSIPITAPNGALVYDNVGKPHVLRDDKPTSDMDKELSKVAKLDNTKAHQLQEMFQKEQPILMAYAIDLKTTIELCKNDSESKACRCVNLLEEHSTQVTKKLITLVEHNEQNEHDGISPYITCVESPYIEYSNKEPSMMLDNATYDWISKQWAILFDEKDDDQDDDSTRRPGCR